MAAPVIGFEHTHKWVAMTFTPVERLGDSDNPTFVDAIDSDRQVETAYGCNRCFIPAVSPKAHLECTPDAP